MYICISLAVKLHQEHYHSLHAQLVVMRVSSQCQIYGSETSFKLWQIISHYVSWQIIPLDYGAWDERVFEAVFPALMPNVLHRMAPSCRTGGPRHLCSSVIINCIMDNPVEHAESGFCPSLFQQGPLQFISIGIGGLQMYYD